MERIIHKIVSRKLRKRGSDYPLSKNSTDANKDFGYANKISSLIFQFGKRSWPAIGDQTVYRRLVKEVVALLRLDEVNPLGELKLGNENVSSLVGFRWNKKRSFSSLIPWTAMIEFDADQYEIEIVVPENKKWEFKKYDERLSAYRIQYHVMRVPYELGEEPAILSSKVLTLSPGVLSDAKKTKFEVRGWDNCLLIVVGSVRCEFHEATGDCVYLSNNASFMAADIMSVFRLKDGLLMLDVLREPSIPQVQIPEEGTDWS